MKIAIGCDHIVTDLKNEVRDTLIDKGIEVIDMGTYDNVRTHYPIFGQRVGLAVANNLVDFGIVICGTGIGISMGAQKIKGTRVALVGDVATIKDARESYDANVLAMGGRVTGIGAATEIIETFLETPYLGKNDELIKKVNNLGSPTETDFNHFLEKWERGEYTD